MPPTFNKVIGLASVKLHDAAEGFPVVVDHGWKHYGVLAQEWPQGTVGIVSGAPALELLPGVGLVNRPYLTWKATTAANWSTSGGIWASFSPSSGSPNVARLNQLDASPDLPWSAQQQYSLPPNPHFAFSLGFYDSPADHDDNTFPPFVRFEFGGDPNQWAVEFHKLFGARVLRKLDGVWTAWADLPEPRGTAGADGGEFVVLVRCYRGRIYLSTDYGKSYVAVGNEDGSPVTVAAGQPILRGQGSMIRFGLHQVRYLEGTFAQQPRDTFTSRPVATPTLVPRYSTPGATSITLSDNSSPSAARAGWVATLTPATIGTLPWTAYYGPELYSVLYSLPVITDEGAGDFTTPWDNEILAVDISLPVDLAGGRATIYVNKDAAVQFTGDYKWRRVDIRLGFRIDTGADEWFDVFVGHIASIGAEQRIFGQAVIPVEVENVTIRAKTTEWSELNCQPLGGMSVNDALDTCLAVLGLGAGFRVWDATGAFVMLPAGAPEDPFLFPQPGDMVWETMRQIAEFGKLEIGATAAGLFFTVPIGYVSPTVDHTWDVNPTDLVERTVQEGTFTFKSGDNVTCIVARGKDAAGNMLMAFGVDTPAEMNTLSGRFSEWRMTHREDVQGTTTLGMLTALVQARFLDVVRPRYDADIRSPVRLDVGRRDRVEVHGAKIGIADADQFAVMTVSIRFTNEGGGASMTMATGLERVAPV